MSVLDVNNLSITFRQGETVETHARCGASVFQH